MRLALKQNDNTAYLGEDHCNNVKLGFRNEYIPIFHYKGKGTKLQPYPSTCSKPKIKAPNLLNMLEIINKVT